MSKGYPYKITEWEYNGFTIGFCKIRRSAVGGEIFSAPDVACPFHFRKQDLRLTDYFAQVSLNDCLLFLIGEWKLTR